MSNLRPLSPIDVMQYMRSILPDSVPPEFVAQAVVLMAPLRIPPALAEKRLLDILRDAMAGTVGVEGTWRKQMAKLHTLQGWHPAEHWTEHNLCAYIDETIARLFPHGEARPLEIF